MSFELIGDDTAPSFFQLEPNGDIKLRSGVNLAADREIQYIVSTCTDYNISERS